MFKVYAIYVIQKICKIYTKYFAIKNFIKKKSLKVEKQALEKKKIIKMKKKLILKKSEFGTKRNLIKKNMI